LFQIYELNFSINTDLVSDVNLERKGAENKGSETYNKLGFVEFSLGNKH